MQRHFTEGVIFGAVKGWAPVAQRVVTSIPRRLRAEPGARILNLVEAR